MRTDAEVPGFWRDLGLPGLVDVHVHFYPERMLRKVWRYFDDARRYGIDWPITYRWPDPDRVAHLDALGVRAFTAFSYAHRPGMAADLTAWARLLGLHDQPDLRDAEPDTLRYRIWHLPARLASHARQRTLAISVSWPWKDAFLACWQRLCALPAPT